MLAHIRGNGKNPERETELIAMGCKNKAEEGSQRKQPCELRRKCSNKKRGSEKYKPGKGGADKGKGRTNGKDGNRELV